MPRTHTFSFQRQFEPLVSSGVKLHTVRRERTGHPPQPGDFAHCYIAQRTKDCALIYASVIEYSRPITITTRRIVTMDEASRIRTVHDADAFAVSDGFNTATPFHDMKTFLGVDSGRPFTGRLHKWANRAELIADALSELAVIGAITDYNAAIETTFGHFDAAMLKAAETHIGKIWAALEWKKRRSETPEANAKAKKRDHCDYTSRLLPPMKNRPGR